MCHKIIFSNKLDFFGQELFSYKGFMLNAYDEGIYLNP
jgi:hypothetical protein